MMIVFSICLACAGAILSLFARLPVLVAVIGLTVLAVVLPAILSAFGIVTSASMPLAALVAVVALQGGYGSGVILKALWVTPSRETVRRPNAPRSEEEIL